MKRITLIIVVLLATLCAVLLYTVWNQRVNAQAQGAGLTYVGKEIPMRYDNGAPVGVDAYSVAPIGDPKAPGDPNGGFVRLASLEPLRYAQARKSAMEYVVLRMRVGRENATFCSESEMVVVEKQRGTNSDGTYWGVFEVDGYDINSDGSKKPWHVWVSLGITAD